MATNWQRNACCARCLFLPASERELTMSLVTPDEPPTPEVELEAGDLSFAPLKMSHLEPFLEIDDADDSWYPL